MSEGRSVIIKVDPYQAQLDAIQKRLDEMGKGRMMRDVLKKAINDVAKDARKELPKETRKMYTIRASQIKQSDITVRKMSNKRCGAELVIKGEPIPIKGGYSSRKNTRKRAASAMIKRAAGAFREMEMVSGGKSYKAFMATMTNVSDSGEISYHTGIFQREPGKKMKSNKKKEKIKELHSLARAKAAEMAYREEMEAEMHTQISFRMLQHMNAVIGKRA